MSPSAKRKDIVEHANEFLDLHKFKDYGPMGQQFTAADNITGIASAVSITGDVIEKTAEAGANMLIVHHGLFWNTEPRTVDARQKQRIAKLNQHKITLLAYHLSLDAHPLIGNNVQAVKAMGVKYPVPFAEIGWGGELSQQVVGEAGLSERIQTAYPGTQITFFGSAPYPIQRVCAITGSGGSFIHQAKQEGYDLFLTGEAEEPSKALAKELGIHFVAAGHYQTEKAGVQLLAEYLGLTFDVPHTFIEDDNPV